MPPLGKFFKNETNEVESGGSFSQTVVTNACYTKAGVPYYSQLLNTIGHANYSAINCNCLDYCSMYTACMLLACPLKMSPL